MHVFFKYGIIKLVIVMIKYLVYLTNGLIILALISYILIVFLNRKKKITDSTAFDITKDILSDYDHINIIENKSIFTVYNIKRRVIKLASKCYYGNTIGDIGVSLIEAGISAIDNYKNKFINFLRSIIPNLKLLYLLPILAIGINMMTYNVSDAKVSIVFIILFSMLQYFLIDIKSNAIVWIYDNIKIVKEVNKDSKEKILKFINNIILIDKIIFISELLIIVRCVAIILN